MTYDWHSRCTHDDSSTEAQRSRRNDTYGVGNSGDFAPDHTDAPRGCNKYVYPGRDACAPQGCR